VGRKIVSRIIACIVSASLAGCAGAQRSPGNNAALLAADAQFDADVAARGLEAWLDWFEDDVATWRNHEIVRGKQTYRSTIGPLLARPGTTLRWLPVAADGDGKFGFTTGRWALHSKSDDGKDAIVETGTYCTVWHKQPDGRWKVIFDLGNDDRK